MRKIGDVAFGFRSDLPLRSRWWHRLFLVAFVLLMIALGLFSVVVLHTRPAMERGNLRIIATLSDYTTAHPELVDAVSSFRELGESGTITDHGEVLPLYLRYDAAYCSADLLAQAEGATEFLRQSAPHNVRDKLDTARVVRWLEEERASGKRRVCFLNTDQGLPSSANIVAYAFTPTAIAIAWCKAIGAALLVCLVVALLLTNLYYRGLVYVVFGARGVLAAPAQHADPADKARMDRDRMA